MGNDKSIRVLIAEDEFLVSEEIARTVRRIGFEVVGEAADGGEAVEMVCDLRPDVVLMDIKMPVVDGLMAAVHIQACCPTPVVLLTAYETPELIARACQTGISGYLTKPPNAAEIGRTIAIAMARHADLVTSQSVSRRFQAKNEELQRTLAGMKTLSGILPVCSYCKKVRENQEHWEHVDVYIRKHSDARISHGICPECLKAYHADFTRYME